MQEIKKLFVAGRMALLLYFLEGFCWRILAFFVHFAR